jgi:hypothetical protein
VPVRQKTYQEMRRQWQKELGDNLKLEYELDRLRHEVNITALGAREADKAQARAKFFERRFMELHPFKGLKDGEYVLPVDVQEELELLELKLDVKHLKEQS